jgi:peptide/nickel transport system substrate-binding protein
MYAMNLEDIAANVHPNAAAPISVPGGDNWGVDAVADQSWIDENLIDYGDQSQPDKAASLMQEAGASRNSDGTWVMDGQPLEYEIATDSNDPRFEQTVASQLSEFGINANIQTYSDTKFFNTLRQGPGYDMWRGPGMAQYYTQTASFWWSSMNYNTALGEEGVRNFFPLEEEQDALEGYADNGWVAGNYNAWEDLTIDVPPIGEPDGQTEEFPVAYENGLKSRGPENYSQEFYKQFMWIANYYLPVLPMVRQFTQTFYDTAHWNWPTDDNLWQYYPVNVTKGKFLHSNLVSADPENPEEGATVNRG